MNKYCIMCGSKMEENDLFCINCGSNQKPPSKKEAIINQEPVQESKPVEKTKLTAGILGIILGGFGAHNFYLGNSTRGIIQIIVSLMTCGIGSLWGITEGVLILLGYIKEDANGNILK